MPNTGGRNLRQPVRFVAAIDAVAAQGACAFVEVSPHPVLGAALRQTLEANGREGRVTASLRRGRSERETLLAALGDLFACGAVVAWERIFPGRARRVTLPSYPWQRQRYWFAPPARAERAQGRIAASGGGAFALRRVSWPGQQGTAFETQLSPGWVSVVGDHRVSGTPILPGTSYLALALAAHAAANGHAAELIEQVEYLEPMAFEDEGERTLQVQLVTDETGTGYKVFSSGRDGEWKLHAAGRLAASADQAAESGALDIAGLQARCATHIGADELYTALAARGLEYGPLFRAVESVWVGENEVLGSIVLPEALRTEAAAFRFHPALLDAALHPLNAFLPQGTQETFLPFALERARFYRTPGDHLWSHIRLRDADAAAAGNWIMDATIHDASGIVAELSGLRMRRAPSGCGGAQDRARLREHAVRDCVAEG